MSQPATQEWVIETLRRALEAMNIRSRLFVTKEGEIAAKVVFSSAHAALATLPAAQPAQPVDAAAVRDAALAEAEAALEAHYRGPSMPGKIIAALRRKQP